MKTHLLQTHVALVLSSHSMLFRGRRRRQIVISTMLMRCLLALLCWTTHIHALAPANPHGWDEYQPDGTPAGRLYLKGHPFDGSGVYTVDQHQHPVVRDEDGWYVYGSLNTTSAAADNDERQRRQLWVPTQHRIGPDSKPPRHLLEQQRFIPPVVLSKEFEDFQCAGLYHSFFCRNQPKYVGRAASNALNFGTTKTIVILVKFSDHAGRTMPPKSDYEFLFNSNEQDEDRTPTGSVNHFMELQSLRQYSIEAHVQDWIVAPNNEEYYSYRMNGLTALFAKCSYEALRKMDEAGTDWSQYDRDGDGVLDSVVIMHSGFSAEGGGDDCINGKPLGAHRIWSHRTAMGENRDAWYSKDRSVRIGSYAATSAVHGFCGHNITRIGVVGHEMLHILGLPDLLGKGGAGSGVGLYDVMGMMWGLDGTQRTPGTLGPWSRQFLGWITPTVLQQDGTYSIRKATVFPNVVSPDVYRIDAGFPQGEYLLVENRKKELMDALFPNDGGILIWHIDENTDSEWMASPGWPDQGGWPGNGNHYQVAILAADREYNLEQGQSYGDLRDAWCSQCWSNQTLILQTGPAKIDAAPQDYSQYPNTDSYSGTIKNTGIVLDEFSPIRDIMTFRFRANGAASPPPPPPPPPPRRRHRLLPIQRHRRLPIRHRHRRHIQLHGRRRIQLRPTRIQLRRRRRIQLRRRHRIQLHRRHRIQHRRRRRIQHRRRHRIQHRRRRRIQLHRRRRSTPPPTPYPPASPTPYPRAPPAISHADTHLADSLLLCQRLLPRRIPHHHLHHSQQNHRRRIPHHHLHHSQQNHRRRIPHRHQLLTQLLIHKRLF